MPIYTDLCMCVFLKVGVFSVTDCSLDLDQAAQIPCDAWVSSKTGSVVGPSADAVTWTSAPISPGEPSSLPPNCFMQAVLAIKPPEWAAKVYFGMEFENPNKFSFHLTDSPTFYGFGKISANNSVAV